MKSPVTMDGQTLSFNTYMGKVVVVFDSAYQEMFGSIGTASPSQEIHLKKVRRSPISKTEIRDLNIDVGDIELKAKLVLPLNYQKPLACAIFVQGRGCRDRFSRLQRAKVLAEYGIAALTFDKRGAKGTGLDCDQTGIEIHSADLVALIKAVAKQEEIDANKIGLIGGSYGGWVAPKAAAMSSVKPAFIVSIVGPATSIKQQQLDNAVYYVKERLGGDEEIIKEIQGYTLLEYEEGNPEKTFAKMQEYLLLAEKNKWKGILSKSDIPQSPDDLDKLWVKRNQYDPAEDLKAFQGPFLSILGGKDRAVPWRENSLRFKELFSQAGKTNYRIVIIPSAPHRLEHGNMLRDFRRIPQTRSFNYYFKFDRVVAGVFDEMILFLKDYDFIP